jgi:hypothetical protein
MDDRGGSFVAVRRISQGLDRGNTCHSTSGISFSRIFLFKFSRDFVDFLSPSMFIPFAFPSLECLFLIVLLYY